MISVSDSGNFDNIEKFLSKKPSLNSILESYGRLGVNALSAATPVESGLTASMWDYEIKATKNGAKITFVNNHINDGVPIAIILQYGHGTGTGGYVQGRDYINPAIQPVFDKLANDMWKEVTS